MVSRLHDTQAERVPLIDAIIVTIGYTDDLALLNLGGENGIEVTSTSQSAKLASIAIASHVDADMRIRIRHQKRQRSCTFENMTKSRGLRMKR